ncbi:MAG: glycosyl transferase family [Geobacteraceae bacterium]|nr:MAG: glycosyl transferase family [Geobacteraceae bacterium]
MADDLLLTVAIPTFNGARTIARSLATILPQVTSEVEVLVSDNASTDATVAVVREIAERNPQVRYARNEINVGFDRNVDLCLQRAQGAFVWLISDDDIICREGAVSRVLEVIRAHPDVAVIFADSRHPIRLNPADSGLCHGGADFFHRSRFKSGLISSNIFRKSAWQAVEVSRYFDSGWVHMGFLLEALVRFPAYVICEELVAQLVLEEGHGITRWGGTGSFLRTGLNLVRIYRTMPELGYDPATVRAACMTIKGGYPKNIPLAKAKGLRVDGPLIRECVELYGRFPSFWLVDLPLLLLPGWLFRGARTLRHALHPEGRGNVH